MFLIMQQPFQNVHCSGCSWQLWNLLQPLKMFKKKLNYIIHCKISSYTLDYSIKTEENKPSNKCRVHWKLLESYKPPRTFSTGIGTFSKNTSAVLEHLIPIFFSGGPLKDNWKSVLLQIKHLEENIQFLICQLLIMKVTII